MSRLDCAQLSASNVRISCILIADNNSVEAAITKRKLELSQLCIQDIVVTKTLSEAITAVKLLKPDVVLLDIQKSVASVKLMRDSTEAVIIVLTDYEQDDVGIESIRAGADDFLDKRRTTSSCLRRAIMFALVRKDMGRTAERVNANLNKLYEIAKC